MLKKKREKKAIYLWDDWLIHAVNGPVSKVMVTALPMSRFKTGFWGCREICINIGITECLLFKIIFLLPRNVLNVDNQACIRKLISTSTPQSQNEMQTPLNLNGSCIVTLVFCENYYGTEPRPGTFGFFVLPVFLWDTNQDTRVVFFFSYALAYSSVMWGV